jgi:type II secretory pathway component PulK
MEPEPRGVDLLTVALLVFFVALIVTVAALLLLPQILG